MIDLGARFPQLAGRRAVAIGQGWDFETFDVEGEWIVRMPRRSEVAALLEVEIRLLRELGPLLPAAVPRFQLFARVGAGVAYRKLRGEPLSHATRASASDLGAFLSALHAFPREHALALGVEEQNREANSKVVEQRWRTFEADVVPLLEPRDRARAVLRVEAFLASEGQVAFEPVLVHRDLSSEHVLADDGGRITGILDWTDACVGDPARDFAWPLHGNDAQFGAALLEAYGRPLDEALRDRAQFYYFLAPFYSVVYGLDNNNQPLIAAALAQVRDRLS